MELATTETKDHRTVGGEPFGLVFNIMRFSLHDGPGIRTTVFFKGCPLSCWWCHNPEGQSCKPRLIFSPDRCLNCGECIRICPHGAATRVDGVIQISSACQACGTCTQVCPGGAREVAGRRMTVSAVMAEIERDAVFWEESGGGVSFSGGEPLFQPAFLEALLDACRARGIHTLVDTCGLADEALLLRVAEKANMFYYDLKLVDPDRHQKYVGASNRIILRNLRALAVRRKNVTIRFPVIPAINDGDEDVERLGALVAELGLTKIDLLPYHRAGIDKYERLGRPYPLPELEPPSRDRLEEIARRLEQKGLNVTIGH